MEKGKIIVIEGTECCGKETQTTLLEQRLKKEGKKVERLSFPDYDTPTGKIVGGPYLGKKNISESYFYEKTIDIDPKVASLYYAADRRYHLKQINDLLNDGYILILDRYVESNMAHQGGKLFDEEKRLKLYEDLANLEYGFLELPRPDITIFLYVSYTKVMELKASRVDIDDNLNNPLHIKNAEFAYLELTKLHNYKKIDCVTKDNKLKDMFEINDEIYKKIIEEIN